MTGEFWNYKREKDPTYFLTGDFSATTFPL